MHKMDNAYCMHTYADIVGIHYADFHRRVQLARMFVVISNNFSLL
jgi:hypothetical protein